MSYYRNDYNSQKIGNCPDNPSLYPMFTKDVIYGYMTHRYTYQKDTTYAKALDYLDSNRIYDLKSNSDCSVFEAKSLGSDGNIYNCRLALSDKRIVDFKCTCMSYLKWHTLCKHLIGMMILIERKRQELLSRQTVTAEKRQELPPQQADTVEEKRKLQSQQTITVKTSVPESNFTIYTCANCGTKYRKYEKVCPLCGSEKRLIGVASEDEQRHMQEVREQLVCEKHRFSKQNDPTQKSQTSYNSTGSYNTNGSNNKKTSDNNTSSDNNDGYAWLIAILVYVVVSVILGLIGGNIGFGFIASILLFVFLAVIKSIYF